jgi:hypothetical protein
LAGGEQGSFLSPSGEDVLERSKPGKLPPDSHLGDWSGARESYTLINDNAPVILEMELDTTDADAEYFNKHFVKPY